MDVCRSVIAQAVILGFCSAASIAQQSPAASSSLVLREFPIVLQQSVEAGKTPVGTKVQAKLAVDTLFHGTAIPRNAVFSGVILESVAKSGSTAARLAIRLETAHWKDRSTCMKAYLMPLYYAATFRPAQSLLDESQDPTSRTMNGAGQSDPRMNQPFPSGDSETIQGAIPDTPTFSNRPVPMKDVVLKPADDGGIVLVSEHANIKLYKMTTYIFAAGEPPAK